MSRPVISSPSNRIRPEVGVSSRPPAWPATFCRRRWGPSPPPACPWAHARLPLSGYFHRPAAARPDVPIAAFESSFPPLRGKQPLSAESVSRPPRAHAQSGKIYFFGVFCVQKNGHPIRVAPSPCRLHYTGERPCAGHAGLCLILAEYNTMCKPSLPKNTFCPPDKPKAPPGST